MGISIARSRRALSRHDEREPHRRKLELRRVRRRGKPAIAPGGTGDSVFAETGSNPLYRLTGGDLCAMAPLDETLVAVAGTHGGREPLDFEHRKARAIDRFKRKQ